MFFVWCVILSEGSRAGIRRHTGRRQGGRASRDRQGPCARPGHMLL